MRPLRAPRARSPIDPSQPEQVRHGLIRLLAEQGMAGIQFVEYPTLLSGGYDTIIYGFRISGEELPPAWQQPLILRIYAALDQEGRARHEAEIQHFAVRAGFPAPEPLLAEGLDNAIGLALMIMPRIQGETLGTRMMTKPWTIGSCLSRMAKLQMRLHELPTAGCPIPYERPLVERQLGRLRESIDRHRMTHLEEPLSWLIARRDVVCEELPCVCHADFHPLNVLLDRDDELWVIDWTETELGDRHYDVARTLAVLWFAKAGAQNAPQRLLLHLSRGVLRKRYLEAYTGLASLDAARLGYWEAYHVLSGWVLLCALPFDTRVAKPNAVSNLDRRLGEEMEKRFWACTNGGHLFV